MHLEIEGRGAITQKTDNIKYTFFIFGHSEVKLGLYGHQYLCFSQKKNRDLPKIYPIYKPRKTSN